MHKAKQGAPTMPLTCDAQVNRTLECLAIKKMHITRSEDVSRLVRSAMHYSIQNTKVAIEGGLYVVCVGYVVNVDLAASRKNFKAELISPVIEEKLGTYANFQKKPLNCSNTHFGRPPEASASTTVRCIPGDTS